ncbi:hypothetical protein ASG40_01930 [Methylobacterium sp. Leaf399]|uniref:GGDEF domain-containing protein n=1 Tax=unclassified Methylobacterium TaxID=2615210 RepID=UPI0006F2803E|nr:MULTISPECIES: diguanylate cyclase [unclassified Methylobacterium]KQP61464.1 hypothetical protein ASF39_01920 [Methylobacterium sp. Leaf108]KQT19614.1 hypothetical protein ASG40_01930 [Methylobacterium sp. Leaf399]
MANDLAQRPLRQRQTLLVYLGTVALAVVALAAMHVATATALATRRDAVVLLDLVREQQAQAQRIAYLAARAATGDTASEFQGGQLVTRFARTHEQLRQADRALGVSPASAEAFQALYAAGERPLVGQVQEFLTQVRSAEDGARQDPNKADRLSAIARFAGETFPSGLDPVVKAYQRSVAARADSLEWTALGLGAVVLVALLTQGLAVARPTWRRLGAHDEAFTALGATDPAGGALSAQSFARRAVAEIRRARRYRRPVSVLAIATGTSGEATDGAVLRTLYGELSETLRPSDIVGMHETGVFSLVLPETDLEAAELAGHRILRVLDGRSMPVDGRVVTVAVRIGVAQIRADEAVPDEALGRAMAALRDARAGGGDRVAVGATR